MHVWAQKGIDVYVKVFQTKLEKVFLRKVTCNIVNSYNGKRFLDQEHGRL